MRVTKPRFRWSGSVGSGRRFVLAWVCEEAVGVGCASTGWAAGVFREAGGVKPVRIADPVGRYLCLAEREEIMRLRAMGLGVRAVAREIGRDPATVSRELRRATGTLGTRPRSPRPASTRTSRAAGGEAGHEPAVAARSPDPPAAPREPGPDRWQTQDRLSQHTGDVGVGRDDLPVAVCPGPRRTQA